MSNYITTNVIQRVFHIKVKNSMGTAFTIEQDNKQYIITAKHIADKIDYPNEIEVYYKQKWIKINVVLVGHGSDDKDISVLTTNFQISPTYPLRATRSNITYSQDVFFLGFPLNIISPDAHINREFPLPLIKKATLSGVVETETTKIDILDGINNPGFSGGPVVCVPPGKKDNDFQVIGVVSGYRIQYENVIHNKEKIDIYAPMNSGLIISYPITIAIDLIKNNPIGFPV